MPLEGPCRIQLPGNPGRFNVTKYEAFLEETDLTPDQKRDLLEALWSIVVSFVELGFGVHPTQAALGEAFASRAKDGKDRSNGVDCQTSSLVSKFRGATRSNAPSVQNSEESC